MFRGESRGQRRGSLSGSLWYPVRRDKLVMDSGRPAATRFATQSPMFIWDPRPPVRLASNQAAYNRRVVSVNYPLRRSLWYRPLRIRHGGNPPEIPGWAEARQSALAEENAVQAARDGWFRTEADANRLRDEALRQRTKRMPNLTKELVDATAQLKKCQDRGWCTDEQVRQFRERNNSLKTQIKELDAAVQYQDNRIAEAKRINRNLLIVLGELEAVVNRFNELQFPTDSTRLALEYWNHRTAADWRWKTDTSWIPQSSKDYFRP
jgi:hypothetical protein